MLIISCKCSFLQIVGDEITQLVDNQKNLESRYEQVIERKQQLRGNSKNMLERKAEAHRDGQAVGGELRNNLHVFARSLKQSPLTPDNLEKVQADRLVNSIIDMGN